MVLVTLYLQRYNSVHEETLDYSELAFSFESNLKLMALLNLSSGAKVLIERFSTQLTLRKLQCLVLIEHFPTQLTLRVLQCLVRIEHFRTILMLRKPHAASY